MPPPLPPPTYRLPLPRTRSPPDRHTVWSHPPKVRPFGITIQQTYFTFGS